MWRQWDWKLNQYLYEYNFYRSYCFLFIIYQQNAHWNRGMVWKRAHNIWSLIFHTSFFWQHLKTLPKILQERSLRIHEILNTKNVFSTTEVEKVCKENNDASRIKDFFIDSIPLLPFCWISHSQKLTLEPSHQPWLGLSFPPFPFGLNPPLWASWGCLRHFPPLQVALPPTEPTVRARKAPIVPSRALNPSKMSRDPWALTRTELSFFPIASIQTMFGRSSMCSLSSWGGSSSGLSLPTFSSLLGLPSSMSWKLSRCVCWMRSSGALLSTAVAGPRSYLTTPGWLLCPSVSCSCCSERSIDPTILVSTLPCNNNNTKVFS